MIVQRVWSAGLGGGVLDWVVVCCELVLCHEMVVCRELVVCCELVVCAWATSGTCGLHSVGRTLWVAQARLAQVEKEWEVYDLKRKKAEAELLMKVRERERAQAEAEARARAVREAQEAAAREAAAKQAVVLAKHKQERAVTAVRGWCWLEPCCRGAGCRAGVDDVVGAHVLLVPTCCFFLG